ncbi:MAG: exodeoxyribonuclease VII small subunit [Thermodesulfovibrionia bacterium]
MARQPSYREAIEELESIVQEIEGEGVDIDVLTEKVKRATFLIKLCKKRLRETDNEVKKILKEFEEGEEEE